MKKSTLYKCAYLLGATVVATLSKYILKVNPCNILIVYTGTALIDIITNNDEE